MRLIGKGKGVVLSFWPYGGKRSGSEQTARLPGEYWCDVTIEYGEGIPVDYYRQAIKFEVVSNVTDAGVVRLDHEWELHTN